MPEIKLVLTDMDDTIAPQMQHVVSEAVRNAIIEVENNGVVVAVVTGRAYAHAKATMNVLGVDGPCVFDGGASVVDTESGKVLWKQWMEVFAIRKVVEILRPYSSDILFTPDYEIQTVATIDVDTIEDEAPFVFALIEDEENIDQLIEKIREIPGLSVWSGGGVHPDTGYRSMAIQVTHHQADKFHGVEALREIVGITKEHTLAIGDGNNDLPLFKNAAVKVAMGNATEGLKEVADYVVGTINEDGFAEAMHKYVLKK